MPATKLIYGVGRVPKASEFSLGEIIVNVDDSKVYSKNKSNVVFEIGGSETTIIGGESDGLGFATASISASGFFTSADTSNLIISGGTGVSVTTGSNNQIIITATGEAEVTNAITASYAHTAELAYTASYVNTSNLDGNLFEFANDGGQGGIIFNENNVDIYSTVGAYAAGLSETSNVIFAQVSSSGLLFASASEETTGGDNIRVIVYDTASGQFYFTGSYGGGGGDDGDWYIDTGNSRLTSSLDVYINGDITGSNNLYINNNILIGDTAGTNKIQFNKSVNANNATTAEVSILADVSSGAYKQSLNFYNVLPTGRYSSLTIGTNEYFKANFNNGARADKYFIINGDDDGVDFIVSGSNFPDLLVAAVDSDNVGVGYGSSSLSATYGDYKLAVSGNLYSDGYLTLASKDNTTGVAGALLYSSSNEFYLGFS